MRAIRSVAPPPKPKESPPGPHKPSSLCPFFLLHCPTHSSSCVSHLIPRLGTFAPETFWKLSCHNQVLMPDNYLESLETQSKHLQFLMRLKPKHLENNDFLNKCLWKYSQLKKNLDFLCNLLRFAFHF